MTLKQADLFAPLPKPEWRSSGAEKSAPVNGPLKGSGTGAKARQSRLPSGARPLLPLSSSGVHKRVARINVVKQTLVELARISAKLAPAISAYQSEVSEARQNIANSIENDGPLAAKAYRIGQHDRIIVAACKWGKQRQENSQNEKLIKAFRRELDELTKEQSS